MKKLYIIISKDEDGGLYPNFTFDVDLIKKIQEAIDKDEIDSEKWCDCDGFHYEALNVPDEMTYASLGINRDLKYEDIFNKKTLNFGVIF